MAEFFPINRAQMHARGWDQPDFVYVSGDAYVDHPSFGPAIICRVLEREGYKVAMLSQPDWRDKLSFMEFGKPRLGFLVSSGNIDSMVNHYTAAKKPRSQDAYSPGGQAGKRPDRAVIVYSNRIREAYGKVPIVIGGIEASLRRFAHYDYWDDRVRNSILVDSGADYLSYGMGERSIPAIARAIEAGMRPEDTEIPGTCVMSQTVPEGYEVIASAAEVARDKKAYAQAFLVQYTQQDPVRGKGIAQLHGKNHLVQHRPDMPLATKELDNVHALPYKYQWHPSYDGAGGVPAIEEVKFSISAVRGCYGSCSFCALTFHQGRIVSARSHASVLAEARKLTHMPDFKGYIHDVGGPTANFRKPACKAQLTRGACAHKQCMYPKPCKEVDSDSREFIDLLREMRALPGVKKVFIRSGLRYDAILNEKDGTFLRELVKHHISGQLKVAPEHISPNVLKYMGKPGQEVYDRFVDRYERENVRAGLKQFLVPYFMSSHPGCTLHDAVMLAEYMHKTGQHPEQVQDFYPTPGTLSTTMFYTGLDPRDMTRVYVPRNPREKAMQRALMQYRRPQNRALVIEALKKAGREDLIGYQKHCLVRPEKKQGERQSLTGGGRGKNPPVREGRVKAPRKGPQKPSRGGASKGKRG